MKEERYRYLYNLNMDSDTYYTEKKAIAKRILDLSQEGYLVYEIINKLGISERNTYKNIKEFLDPKEVLEFEQFKKNNVKII